MCPSDPIDPAHKGIPAGAKPSFPSRILIVRLGAIGDVVNALTLAAAIKDAHPSCHIGWMVHPLSLPLVSKNPVVDHVHVVPRKGLFRGLKGLRKELREQSYELVVDLQRMLKSALLARQAGAPRLLGYDRKRAKEMAWIWYSERIPTGSRHAHMVHQYAQFAEYLGCGGAIRHSLPHWNEATFVQAQPLLAQAPVVVHIGASKPENRWAPERYLALVEGLLQEQSAPVLLTGGPGDSTDALPTERACSPSNRFQSFVGQTSLPELGEILSRARLFISCDTGPMHMAAAMGVRVLALFGPADPRRTGPYGNCHVVLRAPKSLLNGPLPPAVMTSVSSSDTLSAALELLRPI